MMLDTGLDRIPMLAGVSDPSSSSSNIIALPPVGHPVIMVLRGVMMVMLVVGPEWFYSACLFAVINAMGAMKKVATM